MILASVLVPAAFKCALIIVSGAAAYAYIPQWLSAKQRFAYTR